MDLCEFEARLLYIMSFKTARVIERDTVSTNKTKQLNK